MPRLAFAAALLWAGALSAHPEIEDGLARLNREITAQPGTAALYLERGDLYARHAEWVLAEANYLTAAELDPRLPQLDQRRGALAVARGLPSEALRWLDAALTRDPADAEAWVWRGRAHAALGRRPAAAADLGTALRLLAAPTPEIVLERVNLLPAADAVACLDEAIERIGPLPTLHSRAAELEERLGRIDAAATRLQAIAAQAERKEAWQARCGDLYARAGRAAPALSLYRAALESLRLLPAWLQSSPDARALATDLDAKVRALSSSS